MNHDAVICLKDVKKKYRLYSQPIHRIWDMLGLLKKRPGLYTDHWALNGINLTINRGERVAIIGRNGAGKSTLLKLISGVIKKTSGQLSIVGSARALLQIGTGFHMDLTGRDNARAYLLQMGILEREINNLLNEIIEFSELEEYIDQPVKTYSSGMVARLMFATSTAVTPDLLILDEILSVGDAYFTKKSMDRIDDICKMKNSTMLLVSHDIYSASKLVDRMIWIDQGKIFLDASPAVTLRAYEDSIRVQEEARLRKKALLTLKNNDVCVNDILTLELASKNNIPQNSLICFTNINLLLDDEVILSIQADDSLVGEKAGINKDETAMGDIGLYYGKTAFPMMNYSAVQHKVSFYFICENLNLLLAEERLKLSIEYYTPENTELVLRVFCAQTCELSTPFELSPGQWNTSVIDIRPSSYAQAQDINVTGRFGAGNIFLNEIVLKNAMNEQIVIANFGQYVKFCLAYEIKDPRFHQHVDICISILRNGIDTVCRFFSRELALSFEKSPSGVIELVIDEFTLGVGEYTVAVLIAENGYMGQSNLPFYTVNPSVFFTARDLYHFSVVGGEIYTRDTPYVAKGTWKNKMITVDKSEDVENVI